LALGYEDLNDHEQLRSDPLLALLAPKREMDQPLSGKTALNRLERTPVGSPLAERYHKIGYAPAAIDELLVKISLKAHPRAPKQIMLDLDATDMPLHGKQEGRFFHGYYRHYRYLRLYIFCGEHLLCPWLRPSNQDASAGSIPELEWIVRQIRAPWPKVLIAWCEAHRVDYVLGLARDQRLHRKIAPALRQAKQEHVRTGKPALLFTEFFYRTRNSWSRSRPAVAKAEQIEGKENPRYVVTSLGKQAWLAQAMYEQLYCARGEMENRIKEQLSLFSDRLSSETVRANQLRLYFSSLAYVLLHALRCLALRGTEWAQAQAGTIRLQMLKIATQVRVSARRIRVGYSHAYPWKPLFAAAWSALRC
jgi:hypothetical protein